MPRAWQKLVDCISSVWSQYDELESETLGAVVGGWLLDDDMQVSGCDNNSSKSLQRWAPKGPKESL